MTNALRTELRKLLLPLSGTDCYWIQAPGTVTHPYTVISLRDVRHEDGMTQQELEVTVMDYGRDLSRAEDMADRIQQALDHHIILRPEFFCSIYPLDRKPVPEEDRSIIRRRLTFEVRLFRDAAF